MTNKRLNVLVIPGLLPYPPADGGKLCIFGLIDHLRRYHNIQILLYAYSKQDRINIDNLIAEWPDVTVHFVEQYHQEKVIPNYKRRLLPVKKKIKGLFYSVKGLLKKKNVIVSTNKGYDMFGSAPFYPHDEQYINKLTEILSGSKFDIIQTELTRMLNLVNVFPADAKKVFVQIEGRGDVLYDYGVSNDLDPAYVHHVAGNARFLEYAYMKQYDAILALNEKDRDEIADNLPPGVKVYSSPFGILDADIKPLDIINYKAENLIFIGSEGHYPNYDALDWFLTGIVTKFKQRPFAKLYITGWWSPATIQKYQTLCNFVEFIGFVDDLSPYLKNSVSIVPIRIGGGGIRTKILSAMAHGTPVVTTTLAAVGIKGEDKKELLIADTSADFADAISALFNDDKFARNIGKSAYQLLVDQYSQSVVGEVRNQIYNEICAG